jgi:hypothetical protein
MNGKQATEVIGSGVSHLVINDFRVKDASIVYRVNCESGIGVMEVVLY